MPRLSLIETEAQRLLRRLPETRRRTLQAGLIELCETHWRELRGPQPESLLEQAIWEVTPPLADLFLDLYAAGDARLDDALHGHKAAQGLALLVLLEIERGNEAGVHIAHEPMMALETAPPPAAWIERIAALSRGVLDVRLLHRHDSRPPLFRALTVITAHIKRFDLAAVLRIVHLLILPADQSASVTDEALAKLRAGVSAAGICFIGIDDDHIHIEQHGHGHKPVRFRQLAEMLLEIRQMCLR
jgi:hypothetical protein